MKLKHLYVHVKKPLITLPGVWNSRKALYQAALGKDEASPQPARRLHWRESENGSEVIYEGVIDISNIGDIIITGSWTILGGEDATVEESRQVANDLIFANPKTWGEE